MPSSASWAPKSVSVTWALGDEHERTVIEQAHRAARSGGEHQSVAPERGELRRLKLENRKAKHPVTRGDLQRVWDEKAARHGHARERHDRPQQERLGKHNPTFPTLLRISDALGIELAIDITPSGHEPQLIGKRARSNALESFQGNGYAVVVAT
ncbi:MAG TPA: hypothetical protein VK756_11555 [Solirubrobacteraceae bacterium]|jgi:hypothetical protein|nr:hypothetical protein [Solirubrobacteraceae bacterium]